MHPSESLILEFSGNVATSSTSIPLQPDLPECMASSVAVPAGGLSLQISAKLGTAGYFTRLLS